jgi:hypothetical protein
VTGYLHGGMHALGDNSARQGALAGSLPCVIARILSILAFVVLASSWIAFGV